jgi:hypothetical protein
MLYFIYKIESSDTDNIYIGSTRKKLKTRLIEHISSYKKYIKGEYPFYSSFNVLRHSVLLSNVNIEILQEIETDDKNLVKYIERYFISKYRYCCCNKNIPNRKRIEYYKDNKNRILLKMKEWRNNNKEYFRIWRENNPNYFRNKYIEKKNNI